MSDAEWALVRDLLPVPGWLAGRGGWPEATATGNRFGRLARVWADGAYTGHLGDWSAAQLGVVLDVVRRSDDTRGFRVLPRRWVVERSFAWCLRSRRLVRDYERRTDTSEAVILWSMTMLMSRRLAARHQGSALMRAA